MSHATDFISIRLDGSLKTELQQAAEVERRSLSNFCRLLLEYSWGEYLKAGSMRNLVERISTHPIGVRNNGPSNDSGN